MDFSGYSCFARGPFTHRSDRFLHERHFSINCVAHTDSILSHGRTYVRRARAFFRTDLISMMCGPLPLASGQFSLTRNPSELILVTRASHAKHSPRAGLFLLLAWHTWTVFYQNTDLCSPHADLFRSRGPFICYGRTYIPSSRIVLIHRDPE